MPSLSARVAAGCIVATVAFWAYTQTLLPGVDAGDSGGFQAAVLWPEDTARQAYPLYYNLARPFVRAVSSDDPARGLNLVSAIWGAVAVGLVAILGATIATSLAAGVAAALFLGFSYTFWSQAIIAEVYTLHLAFVAGCLLALYAYTAAPSVTRLALFFGVYALAFGNHLSMVLLLVPFAVFLILVTPDRRMLFRPAVVAIAIAAALAGALQYYPNVMSVWWAADAPPTVRDRLAAFWFDVTKADWRETMVLGIEQSQLADRMAMWWFDLQQQFGVIGAATAGAGAFMLWRAHRAWAGLLLGILVANTLFAFTYNVGDAHVFFLLSHFIVAVLAGAVLAAPRGGAGTRSTPWVRGAAAALLFAYTGWRGWDTWPVVDRSQDRRGDQMVAALTLGLDERSLLVTQLDWQIENVLLYRSRQVQPLSWQRLPDVTSRLPFLIEQTHAAGGDVVITADAARDLVSAYGGAFPIVADALPPAPSLGDVVAAVPRGAPYVLCLLTPPRDQPLDPALFARALDQLTGGNPPSLGDGPYRVIAGIAGEAPSYARADRHPFRETIRILDEPFTVRMESWLGTDTFRRAGFGHVQHGRQRPLIVERGVSLVWLTSNGDAETAYAAGLYANRPRFRIPAAATRLARLLPPEPSGHMLWFEK